MDKKRPSRSGTFKAFLNEFTSKGTTEIPYDFHKIHKAFYEVLIKDSSLATQWELLKRTNPSCGGLDKMMQYFQICGIISVDDLLDPKTLVVDASRYGEKPSRREIRIARRLHDNYSELVA